jgi:hypothetical protein
MNARLIRSKRNWLAAPFLCWAGLHTNIQAQPCLMLSRPVVTADGLAQIDLRLSSTSNAAASTIQWTLQFSSANIATLTIQDGSALVAAGKTAICRQDAASSQCLAVGANANPIANGIIARITAVLAPGIAIPSLQVTNPLAASPEGYPLPVRLAGDCTLHLPQTGRPSRFDGIGKLNRRN